VFSGQPILLSGMWEFFMVAPEMVTLIRPFTTCSMPMTSRARNHFVVVTCKGMKFIRRS